MGSFSSRSTKRFAYAIQRVIFLLRTQANAPASAGDRRSLRGGSGVRRESCGMAVDHPGYFLVWSAEAFNTALECLADVLHPERDPGVGRAKDVAAAAVLIAALGAAVIGLLVFVPYLADWTR